MTSPKFPVLRSLFRRTVLSAALAAAVTTPAAATEEIIFDADGDFLPTFVGEQSPELDIQVAGVFIDRGDLFHVFSLQDGFLGASEATFVWGVDRGSGTARLNDGTPGFGAGVTFDAIIVLTGSAITQEASGFVTTFGPGGPTTTDISADVFVHDQSVGAFVPLHLLPSTGFAALDYRVNLWTRDGPGNDHIADFAVDGGTFGVNPGIVPEPGAWALMIAGFALAGGAIRRRRALAPA